MEARNVILTLEKAREFYNSGNAALKEVALQAYTKDELTIPAWQNIKTFEDACEALGIRGNFKLLLDGELREMPDHLRAIWKIDIIRKALNQGWQPKMNEGCIYYPYVRYYLAGDKAKEAARNNGWTVKESFMIEGKKYQLVGGGYADYGSGLGCFGCGVGGGSAYLGLFSCKSRETAEHMSKYFAKEIFNACYIHYVGAYEWV